MEKKNVISIVSRIIMISLIAAGIILTICGFQAGVFDSEQNFRDFISSLGLWGPLIFMIAQAFQVVIPMLPGFVMCIGGAIVFGPVAGAIYSYIGVCIGSVAAFYIARKYGTAIVKKFISEKTYEKYIAWLEKGKKFDIFFLLAIFLPAAPDDVLCFVAGLTRIHWKKFVTIIFLCKPFVIILYSLGTAGFSEILQFLS